MKLKKLFNPDEYSHLFKWVVEMGVMSVVLLVIGLLVVAISYAQNEIVDSSKYPYYWKKLSEVKEIIFVADVYLFLILFSVFSMKLLISIFEDFFPRALVAYLKPKLMPPKERFPEAENFTIDDHIYFCHTTIKKGCRQWLIQKIWKSEDSGKYRTSVSFCEGAKNTDNDVYELLFSEVGPYLLIIGTYEGKQLSEYVAILNDSREKTDGDMCGIILHDTWVKGVKSMSPCMLTKENPLGINGPESTFINDDQTNIKLDRIWEGLSSHENLTPADEPLEYVGVWIYYFKGFKGVNVYGVFCISIEPKTNRLVAEGRAWYFGLMEDGAPSLRGNWNTVHFTSNADYRELVLVYAMRISNPSQYEKEHNETKYSGVLTFELDIDVSDRLNGRITNVDGAVRANAEDVYAHKSTNLKSLDDSDDFEVIKREFKDFFQVDITDNHS